MAEPREWTQDDIDHDMGLDDVCPNCGGEGFVSSCFEEWACVDPEEGCDLCIRRCDWCNPRKPKQPADAVGGVKEP
jgi:hypothetical protein